MIGNLLELQFNIIYGNPLPLIHSDALLSAGAVCFSALGTKHPYSTTRTSMYSQHIKGDNLEPLDKCYLDFLCDSFRLHLQLGKY